MSMIGHLKQITPAKLEEIKKNPSISESLLYETRELGEEEPYDLDKAWMGLHYLLAGDNWQGDDPLIWVIGGGDEIGNDLVYGPAQYLTPEKVRMAAEALSGLTREDLKLKYDPEGWNDLVYPTGIWLDEGDDALEWLLEYFDGLVGYYQDSSSKGNAMLFYVD
jgi:hypothetical protein